MTYDPTIGRWISEDPIGFTAADENLYRYVGNNPTNLVDPSGLAQTQVPIRVIIGSALSDLQRTHKDDVTTFTKNTANWVKSLDPRAFDLFASFDAFKKMVASGLTTAEQKLLAAQLRILYQLASDDKQYVALGTTENPPGKISGLTIKIAPRPDGLLNFGPSIGSFGYTLKPRIDDYELSPDGTFAWARVSIDMSISAGPLGTGSRYNISNDLVWFGVQAGKDYLLPGKTFPLAIGSLKGPFVQTGPWDFTVADRDKAWGPAFPEKLLPPMRIPPMRPPTAILLPPVFKPPMVPKP